jgi:ribonuclease P protein component
MLPKKNKADKKAIEKIFKEGKFVNSPNLTLKFVILKEKALTPRVSFITPKIVSKKAVCRNLLRRRGYFVVKNYISHLPKGFIGAIVFGKKSTTLFGGRKNKVRNPTKALEEEVKMVLNKI